VVGRRRTKDHYSKQAERENYPARSIYKLEEIDKRVKLLRSGDRVLDLGAAPGSWSLYAAQKVGKGGTVWAVDSSPLKVAVPPNIEYLEADVMEESFLDYLNNVIEEKLDVVLSDMAPRTTGHKFVDQSRSFNLFSRALEIARLKLRPGGRFAGKIFFGEDFNQASENVKNLFEKKRIIKPKSVRKESYEVYITGLNRHSSK
jgi:23S rRNA (uridine2552-2'-O)-methyltransferase